MVLVVLVVLLGCVKFVGGVVVLARYSARYVVVLLLSVGTVVDMLLV